MVKYKYNKKGSGDNMKWIDGNEIDLKNYSGKDICQKLALEMYGTGRDKWPECPEFIQNALYIIDFDTECCMEGFDTGNFTADQFSKIMYAFKTIGDDNDANIISEALILDEHYQKLLDNADDEDKYEIISDEFYEKIEKLEEKLYLNTDYDMWSLLYKYLDEQKSKYEL